MNNDDRFLDEFAAFIDRTLREQKERKEKDDKPPAKRPFSAQEEKDSVLTIPLADISAY